MNYYVSSNKLTRLLRALFIVTVPSYRIDEVLSVVVQTRLVRADQVVYSRDPVRKVPFPDYDLVAVL